MSRIPQVSMNDDIRVGGLDSGIGGIGGVDYGAIGRGAQNLGSSMVALGVGLKREKNAEAEKAKRIADGLKDDEWVSNSKATLVKSFTDYTVDENNANSPNFAANFEEFAQGQITEMEKSAPSREAALRFRDQAYTYYGSKYGQAATITAATRIKNTIEGYGNEVQGYLYEYRNSQNNPGAVDALEGNRQQLIETVKNRFGSVAPSTANELIGTINLQIVQETMERNPSYAEDILNQDKYIAPATRARLLKQIHDQQNAINELDRDTFNRERDLVTTNALRGDSYDTLPIEEYTKYYDADRAAVLKREDDFKVAAYQAANDFVEQVAPLNAQAQLKKFDQFMAEAKSPEQRAALQQIVQPAIERNIRMMNEDPTAWLQSTNPAIKRLDAELESASEDQKVVLLEERSDLVLEYQGVAPAGAKNPDQYLGKPSNQFNLLTKEQATSLANQINRQSPSEALNLIRQTLAQYPNEQHQWIVFNDLTSLGKEKLRQEYQLAFQNHEAWWIDTYIAALQGGEAIGEISESKRTELVAMISASPSWVAFQSSIIGDNFERAPELVGYKNGIEAYSRALMLRGTPMKEAVEQSMKMLIDEKLGFTEVNGEPMAVLKQRKDGTIRDEAEIEDMGRRLSYALAYVDPRQIDQTNFVALEGLGEEDRLERLQALRDTITSNGFWQMMPDGQSVTLYHEDDNGQIFQVRDKDGTPVEIDIDELPAFTKQIRSGHNGERTISLKPKKTYNLQQTNRNGTRTYFPTNNEFIR